jgi:hypothetical protein
MLEPRRTAILILGMHRSGTSALTRTLNLLGATAPKRLMPAHESNPRGFWESEHLCTVHEDLLTSVNSYWHDYHRLDSDRLDKEHYRRHIKETIAQEFDNAPLFVLKDPRICRFIPLILSILDELNARPIGVMQIRNPLEVAASLRKRDGFKLQKSLLLWLRHVLDAEYYSRSIRRFFLRYDDLMFGWQACVRRLADSTGLDFHWSNQSEQAIDRFLTLELRHHSVSVEQLETLEVGSWIKDTYKLVSNMAESGENPADLDRLDLIRSEFDAECEIMRRRQSARDSRSIGRREGNKSGSHWR